MDAVNGDVIIVKITFFSGKTSAIDFRETLPLGYKDNASKLVIKWILIIEVSNLLILFIAEEETCSTENEKIKYSTTVFDKINSVYHVNPLVFIGATFRK